MHTPSEKMNLDQSSPITTIRVRMRRNSCEHSAPRSPEQIGPGQTARVGFRAKALHFGPLPRPLVLGVQSLPPNWHPVENLVKWSACGKPAMPHKTKLKFFSGN